MIQMKLPLVLSYRERLFPPHRLYSFCIDLQREFTLELKKIAQESEKTKRKIEISTWCSMLLLFQENSPGETSVI